MKKEYIAPQIKVAELYVEDVMLTASSFPIGGGGGGSEIDNPSEVLSNENSGSYWDD